MYATYDFYRDTYGGALVSETEFSGLAVKASAYLDYYTMGKTKANADMEAVKLACCALVDKYFEIDTLLAKAKESVSAAVSGGKKSETVGSYSVTYTGAEETAKFAHSYAAELQNELPKIVQMYLAGTNLLYRGGCRNVCSAHCNGL